MSTFDEANFMNTETSEQGSTQFTPVPEGDWRALVKDIKPRTVKDDQVILDVNWLIDEAAVTDVTGMESPTVRQSIWLDTTSNGGLDMGKGKNIGLNRLREALGQNIAGSPWKPGMLVGMVARVTVKHRMANENTYADVKGVAKLS